MAPPVTLLRRACEPTAGAMYGRRSAPLLFRADVLTAAEGACAVACGGSARKGGAAGEPAPALLVE
eukprot:gene8863-8068_t